MKENILIRLAWAMPRSLAYWCAVRVMAHATTGKYSHQVVPELTAMDALARWNNEPSAPEPRTDNQLSLGI